MSKIIGNVTATPNPRPDWNQTDETKADYIKNKPTNHATTEYVDEHDANLQTEIDGLKKTDEEHYDHLVNLFTAINNLQTIDQQLSNAIANEKTARESQDSAIISTMQQNVTNLATIDQQLSDAIGNANTKRKEADAALQEQINTLTGGFESTTEALTEKDTDLQSQIDELKPTYSEGLAYALNDDGTAYTLTGRGTCYDTDIVIPPTHEGLPVTRIADEMGFGGDTTSIIIPDSITHIGKYVFNGCKNLIGIELGNGIITVDNGAFQNCTNLATVTFPASVTYIGDLMFYSCPSLDSVTILAETPPAFGSNVFLNSAVNAIYVSASSVEAYKTALPDEVDKIKHIETLETLRADIDDIKYEISPKYSEGMTYSLNADGTGYIVNNIGTCEDTILRVPPTYNNMPVLSIGDQAFRQKTTLTEIILPDSVKDIGGYAFSENPNLTNIAFGNGVTSIGTGAFYLCDGLTSLIFPQSLRNIGSIAFHSCHNLTTITCHADVPPTLEGSCFVFAELTDIYVPANLVEDYQVAWSEYADIIKPFDTLETLRADIDELKANGGGGSGANYDTEIAELTAKDADLQAQITAEKSARETHCNEVLGAAAQAINDNVAALSTIDGQLSAAISEEQTTRKNKDDDLQEQIDNLKAADTNLNNSLVTNVNNLVANDAGLTTAISNEQTARANKDAELSADIETLTKDVYKGLNYTLSDDGARYDVILGDCIDNNIIIPESHNGLPVRSISSFATASDNRIVESVTIPSTVTTINTGAFMGVVTFKKIIFLGVTPPSMADSGINALNLEAILVPYDSVEAYKTATNFDAYADYIKPIETVEILRADIDELRKDTEDIIGTEPSSEGLAYELNEDGVSYSVAGIGTCTDADLVIPSVYEGLPVTNIKANVFMNNTSVITIVLPTSLKTLEAYALSNMSALTTVTFRNTVEMLAPIGYYGQFMNCNALADIYVPWSEGQVDGAPWSASVATIHYNSVVEEEKVPSLWELQAQIDAITATLNSFINAAEVAM